MSIHVRPLILSAALLLPAAGRAERPVAKSISYFMGHTAELAVTLPVCHDNSQFANTPTCVNAEAAATALSVRDAPNLRALLGDWRYWSANPVARDGLLQQCERGTAMEPQFCGPAARSALGDR